MEKQISFVYEGATYTLAFNRKTVQMLSQQGFKTDMLIDQPAIGIPMLFKGAFLVHHRGIRSDLVDKIYDSMNGKTDLIGKIVEMYVEPINALFEEPKEDDEKNVPWEANF